MFIRFIMYLIIKKINSEIKINIRKVCLAKTLAKTKIKLVLCKIYSTCGNSYTLFLVHLV